MSGDIATFKKSSLLLLSSRRHGKKIKP